MGFDPVSYILGAKSGGGGGGVTVEPLSVTENGTYTAPEGKAYSPVTVDVPTRDPNLYEKFRSIELPRDHLWNDEPTITIDIGYVATTIGTMCNGGGSNPGYKKIKLKNVSVSQTKTIQTGSAFSSHPITSAFEFLEFDADLIASGNCSAMFDNNKSLKSVTGGAISLAAASNISNFARSAEKLETISFVPSSIKLTITFYGASKLTDDSVVSICNGLDGTVSGQTLTLDSTVKARLSAILGTVTDGIFAIDAQGSTTLLDFATTTKGWTLA